MKELHNFLEEYVEAAAADTMQLCHANVAKTCPKKYSRSSSQAIWELHQKSAQLSIGLVIFPPLIASNQRKAQHSA